MSAVVHPTAIVEEGATLGENVKIGPYCMVGPDVVLGDGTELVGHAVVAGKTVMGRNNRVFPFASIGHPPQDMKYKGEPSRLEIGDNNVVREQVTINPGTEGGGMVTKVGNNILMMVGSHVAHDCAVGNNCILVNNATLAGHVVLGDFAIVGGLSAVHQFVRVGKHAMIGGMTGVESDVIPYASVTGNRARLQGLNLIGLKRRGFDRETIHDLRAAYRLLFAREGTMAERMRDVDDMFGGHEPVRDILDFIRTDSSRAICRPVMDDAA